MSYIWKSPLIVLVCLLVLTHGCIYPPAEPGSALKRYQELMIQRNPDERAGSEGLDALIPATSNYTPPLQIEEVTDPDTGAPAGRVIKLSLHEAIVRGLANNLDIGIVSFEPAVTREQMMEAAAEFDVTVFGTAALTRNNILTASALETGVTKSAFYEVGLTQKTTTGAVWSAKWQLTRITDNNTFVTLKTRYEPIFQLEFAQPLLRDAWPQFNLARIRVAQINHRITRAQFRQKVEEIVTQIVEAYWRLAEARRELVIRQTVEAAAEMTLKRLRLRRDIDARVAEISQAESALASRSARVFQAAKRRHDIQDALAKLLNDPQAFLLCECEIIPTTEALERQLIIDEADQLVTALQYNPVLEQAREAIAIAQINVEVAKNQTLPSLDFTATGSYQGLARDYNQAMENLDTLDFESYSVAIRLEYPLGNRERIARLRQAELRRLQSVTDLQNTADLVAINVRERIRQIGTSYQELQVERAASAAAKRQLRALDATERLTGRLTPEFLNVKLSAQDAIAQAESNVARALASYNIAWYELARATGTVLELAQVRLALPAAMGETTDEAIDELILDQAGEQLAPTTAPARDLEMLGPGPGGQDIGL